MTVAPRQNLASLILSSTWALHGGWNRLDQMIAHTTSFSSWAQAAHDTFWYVPYGTVPWPCLQWFTKKQDVSLEFHLRVDGGTSVLACTPTHASELMWTKVLYLDKGSYLMPPVRSSLLFKCRCSHAETNAVFLRYSYSVQLLYS